MRTSTLLSPILALGVSACFDVPVLPPRDVGARDARLRDAHTPEPLAVVAVRALDSRGEAWPLAAVPRRVTFELELTSPLAEDAESLVLLRGEPDAALADDLERRPLLVATRARAILADVTQEGTRVRVVPHESFAPADVLTLAIASFATSIEGQPLGSPSLTRVVVSDDPRAGARVIATFPADGTLDVPTNAEPLVIALDGDVTLADGAVTVEGQRGLLPITVAGASCAPLGLDAARCMTVAARDRWPSGERLAIQTTDALRDATGAAVPTHRIEMTTATGPDLSPPTFLSRVGCPLDAEPDSSPGCLLVTDETWQLELLVDEPVRVVLTRAGAVLRALAPRGTAMLTVRGLAPSTYEEATLEVVDLAGLRSSQSIVVTTHAAMLPITITEVCANPIGAEPDQEWIELANVGDVPARLSGVAISDRDDEPGTVLSTERTLVPGARVLLVGEDLDADAAGVPPGTPLVVVGRTLVTAGIANSGEALFLRDSDGQRLASVPALAAREGECVVRDADAHARADAIDDFHYDACTPGR